ncbi:FAD-binding oxidoreductase [uncultured Paracoccus sp.]|uniref:FAD-binding oxidoreductase n=1 Tax=uncultured Paracoccus sp. TaxID=189685 RepID=UPI0025FAD91A|nr:FAD-binding oxidoreductase [uncultured Paracoccus sp.]
MTGAALQDGVILAELADVLGSHAVLVDTADRERYRCDQSGHAAGMPIAVLRPATTEAAAQAVALCAQHRVAIVPQGGRTGLSGGGSAIDGCVILSLERLVGVEELDAATMTMTVRAGTPLEQVQEAARRHGLDYPVDIGARGTATIGGTIATNAGGIRVLRFGMTRHHVLGLEAILPDGSILSRMGRTAKDNTGYDLKQLLIGSEGTLGVICRAVLQLRPWRANSALALVGLRDHAAALRCLTSLRQRFDTRLIAFEGMWPDYWKLVCHDSGLAKPPFAGGHGFHVLFEVELPDNEGPGDVEDWFAEVSENDLVQDGVLAQSLADHGALWRLREAVGEIDDALGPHINFDIGIDPSRLGRFCDQADRMLDALPQAGRTVKVGHVGDGNVHLLVAHSGLSKDVKIVEQAIYGLVQDYRGAVTAEHGVGRLKADWLRHSRSDTEVAVMAAVKSSLDPHGIMNPGSVLPCVHRGAGHFGSK